jgi:hypothetical protein
MVLSLFFINFEKVPPMEITSSSGYWAEKYNSFSELGWILTVYWSRVLGLPKPVIWCAVIH